MTEIFYRITVGFVGADGEDDGAVSLEKKFARTDGREHDPVDFINRLLEHPEMHAEMLHEIRGGFEIASELVTPGEQS